MKSSRFSLRETLGNRTGAGVTGHTKSMIAFLVTAHGSMGIGDSIDGRLG